MKTRQFLLIAVCALIIALGLNVVTPRSRLFGGIAGHTTFAAKVSPLARALRPNYPYSIIPGGAYSPAELRAANQKDPLVRSHYSDFNVKGVRLVTLSDDRYQYVSFRLNNRIFWTHKKLRIPKGEILLTDGYNYARTRCGNRLSSTPKADTTPLEPAAQLLSLPPYNPKLLPELPFAQPPSIGEIVRELPLLPFASPTLAPVLPAITAVEGWPQLPNYPPIIPIPAAYVRTPTHTPRTPGSGPVITPLAPVISHVPEPASLYLFGIALCASLWLITRTLRRHREANPRSNEN